MQKPLGSGSLNGEKIRTIRLHNLCWNCRVFCDTWEVLDYLTITKNEDIRKSRDWPYAYFFCTVAHLNASQTSCHLCKIVHESIGRRKNLQKHYLLDKNVYFRHYVENEGEIGISLMLYHKLPMDRNDRIGRQQITWEAGFSLKAYSSE